MNGTAAILRDVYGHNAAKKIARRFNVATVTAKIWLAGRFPETRTNELVAVVRQELEIIDARNKKIREQLGIGNGGGRHADTSDAVAARADFGRVVADFGRVVSNVGRVIAAGPEIDGSGNEIADV